MDTIKVKVLGTEYNVFLATEDNQPRLRGLDGFCDDSVKEIYVDDMSKAAQSPDSKKDLAAYRNKVMRHELTHAMPKNLFDLVLIGMFIGFYALGVSVGKAATNYDDYSEPAVYMEHTHGGNEP